MSNIIILVSEEKLKAFTQVHTNVQVNQLTPGVIQSQDLYIQPLLGTTLYNEILTAAKAGTLTVKQRLLIDSYIANALMNRSLAMLLPFIKFKIVNKGLISGSSETADQVGLDELKYLVAKVTDTAQFYEQRLVEYLNNNIEDYPSYTSCNDMQSEKGTPYFSGIVTNITKDKRQWGTKY